MANNSKKTSISLSEDTKQQLAQFEKQKGESYDDILNRVMVDAAALCNKTSDDDAVAEKSEE